MPPRLLPIRSCLRSIDAAAAAAPTARQLPLLTLSSQHKTPTAPSSHNHHLIQTRHASILSSLADVPGAYNKRIRRGRGPSSGKGKTSGRGHKGQKQHGKVPAGFNGGQTPDEVVAGARGFTNNHSRDMTTLNLDRVASWIEQGRLDAGRVITVKELHESRCTHGIKDGIKLLAKNCDTLKTPIHIVVSRASASAIKAVEAAGGTVLTRYYTRPSIRRILKGQTHPVLSLQSEELALSAEADDSAEASSISMASAAEVPAQSLSKILTQLPPLSTFRYRLPDPASRADIEYYRDGAHRGYLSYTVSAGEGPSLFFKTPGRAMKTLSGSSSGKRSAITAGESADAVDSSAAGAQRRSSTSAQSLGRVW